MDSTRTDGNALPKTPRTVADLVQLARQGHREVLPVLGKRLDERPEMWQNYGNLAHQARSHWLKLISGNDLYLQGSMRRYYANLESELAGPDASPLEQLLVGRIVALSLQVDYFETLAAQNEATANGKLLRDLHEQSAAADRRLQQAIVNLARVRKLLPGVVKVEVVVSGEVEANLSSAETSPEPSVVGHDGTSLQVPRNRFAELMALAGK